MASGKKVGPKYEVRDKRLRIRFSLRGVRYGAALGWEDTPTNRGLAEKVVGDIKRDIFHDRFDYGDRNLTRYRVGEEFVRGLEEPPQQEDWPAIETLFGLYLEHKKDSYSPSTCRGYENCAAMLARYPGPIADGDALRAWIRTETTKAYGTRILRTFSVVLDWACREKLVPVNPLTGLGVAYSSPAKRLSIEFWERPERDLIISYFQESSRLAPYAAFVEFLFLMGCRPSEALALTWGGVTEGCGRVTFTEAVVAGSKGKSTLKKGLKTQASRTVRTGNRSRELLLSMQAQSSHDRLFLGPRGGPLSWKSFREKVWPFALQELNLPYKKPYSMRHTMITLALRGDPNTDPPIPALDVARVAAMVGNSASVIYKHYAGVSSMLTLPE